VAREAPDSPSNAEPTDPPSQDTRDWEDYKFGDVKTFKDLPSRAFGFNQHMLINNELKAVLTQMLRDFRAPIVFCFAYGSGVFPQEQGTRSITDAEFRAVHPKPPEALRKTQNGRPKMMDFIFGVSFSNDWHWRNIRQHRDHYSALASLGSSATSWVQENLGAGVYFNTDAVMNGMLIKYGVTTIQNLCSDLSTWETLYLAGRLHKPVKILRDNAAVRVANQQNLVGAVRTALLMLPEHFTEFDLFRTIAGISYLGDPRMSLPTENRSKVNNIVANNFVNFRRLYAPLIEKLPNTQYSGGSDVGNPDWIESAEFRRLEQDMDPVKRANMVRRLPSSFRSRLYFQYQARFGMTRGEYMRLVEETSDEDKAGIKRKLGGKFEMRIAEDGVDDLTAMVRKAIEQTVYWPSVTQSAKGLLTAGFSKSVGYVASKVARYGEGHADAAKEALDVKEAAKVAESKVAEAKGDGAEPQSDVKKAGSEQSGAGR
jgi:mitochondrial translocator assembly and maintenance protein 41